MNSQKDDKPQNEQESESNQEDPALVNTEQNLVAKIREENDQLKNELKILNESQDEVKKSFKDLKNLVMSQNQQKLHSEQENTSDNENTSTGDEDQNCAVIEKFSLKIFTENTEEPEFEIPFEFERPTKKIKLEDQNEEIPKLKQVIEDLRKDVMKLSEENATLSKANVEYEEKQKQNEAIVKNLKEDNLKLHQEILNLKYDHL